MANKELFTEVERKMIEASKILDSSANSQVGSALDDPFTELPAPSQPAATVAGATQSKAEFITNTSPAIEPKLTTNSRPISSDSNPISTENKGSQDDILVSSVLEKENVKNDRTSRINELAALVRKFAVTSHLCFQHKGHTYVKSDVWRYLADILSIRYVCYVDYKLEQTKDIPRQRPVKSSAARKPDYTPTFVVTCECVLYEEGDNVTFGEANGWGLASDDEPFLHGKPPYSVVNLARTRAFVRAMQERYGHIIAAAGFSSTPFEEIINDPYEERIKQGVADALAKLSAQHEQSEESKVSKKVGEENGKK